MFSRQSSVAPKAEAPHFDQLPESKTSAPVDVSTPPPSEAAQKQNILAIRQSLAFAQVVSLLMRSPTYRHFFLADLEWLAIPPLASGMFAVAEVKAQADRPAFPGAAVLWASVSPEVDARLSGNLTAPIRLRPDEWRSGDRLWVIAAVGDQRVLNGLLQQLSKSAFKERKVNLRVVSSDGRVGIKFLDEVFPAKTDAAA